MLCLSVSGQNNKLVENCNSLDTEAETLKILQKSAAYISVDFVSINIDKIADNEKFVLEFGKNSISVYKERIDVRGIKNFCFVGRNEDGNSIVISVLDDDIQGVIETPNGVYSIETVEAGKCRYAVIKVDQSQLKEACDDLEYKDAEIAEKNNVAEINDNVKINDNVNEASSLSFAEAYECKIRVLVLYTPAAQSSVSNIKNTTLLAVELANQSFINSNISHQIELAYAGLTNYTESGSAITDMNRFRNNNDGYMDEVHTLRNKYAADVCVLLDYTSETCGLAYNIGVSANDAFCVVSTYSNCATSYYSFVHEIGHLLGCRHDTYVDNNNTPFAYGHGYIFSGPIGGQRRTIMAYGNGCSDCQRIQYWSNPNVKYGGLVPMGTTSTNNNARVWNERSSTVMTFRQPDNNVTVTSDDVPNTTYGDVIAKQNITTNGTVTVSDGATVNMRAGNSIILQDGFHAVAGSLFDAAIENIYNCGSTSSNAIKNNSDETDELNKFGIDSENISSFSCLVYPNPTDDFINIEYSINKETPLSIEIFDFMGNKIKSCLPKQIQKIGTYSFQVSVSNLVTGTYFMIFSLPEQKIVKKGLMVKSEDEK